MLGPFAPVPSEDPMRPVPPPSARFTSALLTGLVLLAPAARAGTAPDAAPIVRRYLEATGGEAAFAAESTSYARARLEAFGFTGTLESWSARPLRHYASTELGPFQLREGVDGATAWRTDPTTGMIRALADHDLDNALASTWFDLERWAEPDADGGTVRLGGSQKDSLGTYTVLEVTPPDLAKSGRPVRTRRLWFHDGTGLLMRLESRDDQRNITTSLRDWRPGGLRKRAFMNETMVADLPANRLLATYDSVRSNVSVDGLAFSAPSQQGTGVRWLASEGHARLPFEYRARHVWLKARINGGPPEDFLFDTGASVTVLDSSWAAEHGLKTEGRMQAAGAGAAGGASFATLGSLRIEAASGDGIEVTNVKTAVLDVNPNFAPLFWRRMAGVIGYDVISRFVVTIDYDDSVLVLHDPAKFRYEGREKPLPMVMNGTVPALTARLDGQDEGLFRLDVGSSSTVDLHSPFAKAHNIVPRLGRTQKVDGVGFGGSFESETGRLRSMNIGPYEWDDPIVSVAHATEGAFASEDFAGNIGNRILERFRVTFDYERRHVYLEPGRRYQERDHLTRCGVLLSREGQDVRVANVLFGSPADRGGLRAGDQVLQLAGQPIAKWDLPQVSALLDDGTPGEKVVFRVQRGGKEHQLKVKLADVIR
jgi:hypothetical protein